MILSALLLVTWVAAPGWATPTQYGVSGLLSQPSADTLEAGNLAAGIWLNGSEQSDGDGATILPVSLTIGLGSFIEAYGSFPNLLFNDEEAASGRGFADLGLKARVLGKRSSPYKLAIDIQGRRHILDDPARDGATDYLVRGITTYKNGRLGLHLNGGYLFNDETTGADDQIVAGAGIEYFPMSRLRLIAELEGATERFTGADDELEVMGGLQYFVSPHLTLHAGVGVGLTDASADWRLLLGLSASQGIGTFTKPLPRVIQPVLPKKEVSKPRHEPKFRTITPLLPMSRLGKPEPKIATELPVNPGEEKLTLEPNAQLVLPAETKEQKSVSPIASPVPPQQSVEKSFTVEKPIKMVVYRKFRFDDVNFAFDQFSLSAEGSKALSQVAKSLRKEKKWFLLRIDGHTDSVGSEYYNEKLSYKRAVSVAEQLVTREGFDPARIFVKGFGEEMPIASNKTAEGRQQNRRAEILVLLPERDE